MSSSKETNVRKWDFENTKLFYEVLQGKFPENYPIHCDLKLTPEQAFDVIYILQEYFNAIPDVFEQCYRCKELYDSDCGGNHYDNVGINLCEWCEDHILYREGYGGDYETLDEYVEKWFKSTKSDSERLDAVESIKEARNAEADKDIEIVWGSQKSDNLRRAETI